MGSPESRGSVVESVGLAMRRSRVRILAAVNQMFLLDQFSSLSVFGTDHPRIFNIRWPEKIRNGELWQRAGQEPVAKQILRRNARVRACVRACVCVCVCVCVAGGWLS
nr:hypothetical protein BaRGS_001384 [Batillaria attramentaria]